MSLGFNILENGRVNYNSSVPKLVGQENHDAWCFSLENMLLLDDCCEREAIILNLNDRPVIICAS